MSSLDQIQTDFQDFILGRSGAQRAMAAHLSASHGMSAEQRLAIYAHAYRVRLRAALGASFEKTRSYLGHAEFSRLADDYIATHTSHHASLRWFGAQFASFAARALPDRPLIGELATLEWALGIAFDAPDVEAITLAQLSALPPDTWGDLVFTVHPAVQLLTLASNAGALWQALNVNTNAKETREQSPQTWLVWRQNLQSHMRVLDPSEAQALAHVAEGATFGGVCAAVAAMPPVASSDRTSPSHQVASYLHSWLAQGLLSAASSME